MQQENNEQNFTSNYNVPILNVAENDVVVCYIWDCCLA